MDCCSASRTPRRTCCNYTGRWFKIFRVCYCRECSKARPKSTEEAQGYKRLIDEFSYDQEKVSKFIGKSRSYIANSLRLLTLPADVIRLIENQKLTSGHAKVLVGLENANFLATKIIEKKLSVRQTEHFVKIFKNKKKQLKSYKDPNIRELEHSTSEKIGLNVVIKNSPKNKGSISFFYNDLEQLNKLIETIKNSY